MEKICANLIASCTKKINRKFKYKTKLVNNYHQRMTAMADAPTYRHMVHLDCCEKNLFLKYTCVYLYIKKCLNFNEFQVQHMRECENKIVND